MASAEPWTSALIRIANSLRPASLSWLIICSSDERALGAPRVSRRLRSRYSVISRARASLSTTTMWSPASGADDMPSTSTGIDGPASVTVSPRSSTRARMRPQAEPATTMSPVCSVPRWTSTVATGPRPLSSWASTTMPSPGRAGLARRLRSSACSTMASSSLSRFIRLRAEISTSSVSPPMLSTTMS